MTTANLPNTPYRGSLIDRLQQAGRTIQMVFRLTLFTIFKVTIGRRSKAQLIEKARRGSLIDLTMFSFPGPGPRYEIYPKDQAADMRPDATVPNRKSRAMAKETYPEPVYPFKWSEPPVSGNVINGLGETERRRPLKVFHSGNFSSPWAAMEWYFYTLNPFRSFWAINRAQMDNLRLTGPVSPHSVIPEDPAAAAVMVKQAARECGATLVGITHMRDELYFDGVDLDYKYAIAVAIPMDRETMLQAPGEETLNHVMDIYVDVSRVAVDLAERIRSAGHDARACTNLGDGANTVQQVPLAIETGLGQLGKHGSIITKDFGSNVRLATVLTNLPLEVDEPEDIGVDDFCATCQICVTNCPPHAIFDTKQMVRGDEKWYVNFDRCAPYFSENGGCAICIEVCPWSEPGRGSVISEKMLARRKLETQ
ncbi:MAG: 4Fe-4S dicluster domain-containing protein [Chloroflexales bacterium]|nr:4Fe-4S dicluster domain-containing protein [Chloroflexales bacterium]